MEIYMTTDNRGTFFLRKDSESEVSWHWFVYNDEEKRNFFSKLMFCCFCFFFSICSRCCFIELIWQHARRNILRISDTRTHTYIYIHTTLFIIDIRKIIRTITHTCALNAYLSHTHTNETTHNPHLPNHMITHTRERSHTQTRACKVQTIIPSPYLNPNSVFFFSPSPPHFFFSFTGWSPALISLGGDSHWEHTR